jgi:hypothetical protein
LFVLGVWPGRTSKKRNQIEFFGFAFLVIHFVKDWSGKLGRNYLAWFAWKWGELDRSWFCFVQSLIKMGKVSFTSFELFLVSFNLVGWFSWKNTKGDSSVWIDESEERAGQI